MSKVHLQYVSTLPTQTGHQRKKTRPNWDGSSAVPPKFNPLALDPSHTQSDEDCTLRQIKLANRVGLDPAPYRERPESPYASAFSSTHPAARLDKAEAHAALQWISSEIHSVQLAYQGSTAPDSLQDTLAPTRSLLRRDPYIPVCLL